MGDEILLALIGLGIVLAIPLLAIIAFARTGTQRRQIEELRQELNSALERLAGLERRSAAQPRTAPPVAPESRPAEVPTPAVETPAPPVAPPPVVRPEPELITAMPEPRPVPESQPGPKPQPRSEAPPRPEPRPEPAVMFPPVEPPRPAAPNPVVAWVLHGNPVAKLGIVILFFGLAYLLRYVSERGYLSIEIRLSSAAVIALGLLVVGWRLRQRSPVYALTLQGGSIGALYITSFAAFRIYGLLEHGLVFGLLIAICAASVMLAVIQRAQSLALLASLGGYLAPVLLSTGGGNHVALFSYYALLSTGILAISVWQAWRPLNLIGFAFTFGIGSLWGLNNYQPAHYASAQFFLILNLLIYGVAAVLTSLRRGDSRDAAIVDGTLAFGTPLIGFGLQVGLTSRWEYGPAFSALAFGAVYLPLAMLTMRRWPARGRLITIAFLALGAGFVTLAIPLALSAKWTAMAWALEGLGVLWAGRTQRHGGMTWSGTGLLMMAAITAANAFTEQHHLLDTPTVIMMLGTLSLSWLAAGALWRESGDQQANKALSLLFLGGSMAEWLFLVADVSDRLTNGPREALLALFIMSGSALGWHWLGSRLRWRALELCAFLLWPVAALVLLVQLGREENPFGAGWWSIAWVLALATGWQLLRLNRSKERTGLPTLHATFGWLVFAVAVSEIYWRLDDRGWGTDEWPLAGILAVCGLAILTAWMMARRRHWALESFSRAYWLAALTPAVAVAAIAMLNANLLDGRLPDIPYIPLLSVLDEPALFALLMLAVWRHSMSSLTGESHRGWTLALVVGLLVWWANGVLLRTLSMIGHVPWSADHLWDSAFIQTSVAICWTAAALVAMAIAARRRLRAMWIAGAVQLGVVVLKLFLVDSANTSGLARAVAFIGVALLILIIGYLAPLPPRSTVSESAAPAEPAGGEGGAS